jgi:hypothetical protein
VSPLASVFTWRPCAGSDRRRPTLRRSSNARSVRSPLIARAGAAGPQRWLRRDVTHTPPRHYRRSIAAGPSGCAVNSAGSCGFQLDHNVSVFTSPDLAHWTDYPTPAFQVAQAPLPGGSGAVLFCPKVLRHPQSGTYVMWFNWCVVGTRGGARARVHPHCSRGLATSCTTLSPAHPLAHRQDRGQRLCGLLLRGGHLGIPAGALHGAGARHQDAGVGGHRRLRPVPGEEGGGGGWGGGTGHPSASTA